MPVQNRLITTERVEPNVAKIVLNNPPLNLVTLELTEQLIEAIDGLERDNSVRVVIITGAGNEAFCAGSDVKEFPAVREQIVEKRLARENQAFSNIEFLPKPVIAAIEGVALGSGCEMSLACDIRIVARMHGSVPEIKLGVFPGSGGQYRLPKLVGTSRAVELM